MISVAVKVETECGTCRMPMPVNTLAREVGCPSCGRPTPVDGDVWQALLRDPVYEGPRMLRNEGRRSSAGKISADYTRRGPSCHGCEKEISVASIQEVRDQAMLRCERCAKQTWVRRVPAELAEVLPNITHLVGEDPDPLAGAPAAGAQAATFPCPQCGSPVAFDGVNRACTCRFCSASVHVPDEFVYRGRRKVAASWFLCFEPSIADNAPAPQAVSAGLFDWDEPPLATVDAEGNLYCAARQLYWVPVEGDLPKQKGDNVLWSIDPSLNIRWLHRGRSRAAHLALSPSGMLLVTDLGRSSRPWLSSRTGLPVEGADGTVKEIHCDLLRRDVLACDRDGTLLILQGGVLRRISPSGADVPAGPGGDAGGALRAENLAGLTNIYCGPDGSTYLMYRDELVRLDPDGEKKYKVTLSAEASDVQFSTLGADLGVNAYVLRSGQILRISATGEQRVILSSGRDRLPWRQMSIAVCPEGALWLFGKNGAAWKFDGNGVMVFASEKEARPKKLTSNDVYERQQADVKAKILAEHEKERVRLFNEHAHVLHRQQRPGRIAALIFLAFVVLVVIAVFRL
ncbi:hypothetical protein [Sorangium sp. So ce176]|uniref:hypothetical protein n=1 Tax=Sorangium sp. So ce176 TaxID=3133286 RepID=UPI003F6260CB